MTMFKTGDKVRINENKLKRKYNETSNVNGIDRKIVDEEYVGKSFVVNYMYETSMTICYNGIQKSRYIWDCEIFDLDFDSFDIGL